MEKNRGTYRIFVVKPEGKRPLGRPRRRWENNIHTGVQEIGWESTLFSYGSGQGQVSGSCKEVNKLSHVP
jgi:hypothetical protein